MGEHPSTHPHWTDYLVRFLSDDGAGTRKAIRTAGERFSYANGTSQRTVTWGQDRGLTTVTIATDPAAQLTINDALATRTTSGLDAIAQTHLTKLTRHRARYQPVQLSINLDGKLATWSGRNYFPNGSFPYETFAAIIREGIGALDQRSLAELSTDWRPRTWHSEPGLLRYTKPTQFLQS